MESFKDKGKLSYFKGDVYLRTDNQNQNKRLNTQEVLGHVGFDK